MRTDAAGFPLAIFWRGQDVREMGRDDLIEAVIELVCLCAEERDRTMRLTNEMMGMRPVKGGK